MGDGKASRFADEIRGSLRHDDQLRPLFPCKSATPVPAGARQRDFAMSTAQNPWPPIGQLFVEQGHLTAAQLEAALVEQEKTGGRLGEILVERGYISRTDLAGALSKQWSWKNHTPRSIELPVALVPSPQESVEPEPVAPAPELVPVPAPPAIDPPPVEAPMVAEVEDHAVSQWQPSPTPTVEESTEPSASSARIDDQERLLQDLQARLRGTHEQLAAGEARLGSLEAMLGELSRAFATLNTRLDAQTREIEDLRRVVADQATRLATAASALLA
jgi:hypothetical protein